MTGSQQLVRSFLVGRPTCCQELVIKCEDEDCTLGFTGGKGDGLMKAHDVRLYKQVDKYNNYPFWKSKEFADGGRIAMWGDGGDMDIGDLDWEIGTIENCDHGAKTCEPKKIKDADGKVIRESEVRLFSNEYDPCPQFVKNWELKDAKGNPDPNDPDSQTFAVHLECSK